MMPISASLSRDQISQSMPILRPGVEDAADGGSDALWSSRVGTGTTQSASIPSRSAVSTAWLRVVTPSLR